MATITPRKRKDGTTAYRAQIIIKQGGNVHREGETFNSERDAKLWIAAREKALAKPDALEIYAKKKTDVTVKKLIERYESKVGKIKQWGRSKQAVLDAWKERDEGQALASEITSSWLIDYCIKRKAEEGASPSTINQDIAFLRSVVSVAHDVLGVPISMAPFIDARPTLKKLGLVGKGEERDRRPEYDEISAIVECAYNTRKGPYGRAHDFCPLDKLIVFQMFSGRRIAETCRILWKDLDRANQRVLVRDMKDPSRKDGNDVLVSIPNEAFAVIESMTETDERIFPYNSRSVCTNFQRVRAKAGYHHTDNFDNLKVHDLRHECLSWLAEKNGLPNEHWDVPRLQRVSGHKGWNSLQRYVNIMEDKPVDRWAKWEWKTKVLD